MTQFLFRDYRYFKAGAVLAVLLIMCSCGTPQPFYQSGSSGKPDSVKAKKADYEVFLIGDTGRPVLNGTDPVLNTLQYQLEQAGDSSSIIYLGDNIYQTGMNPDTTYQARKEDENIMSRQLETLKNYGGKSFFIPGNHDWYNGIRGVRAQERFIESRSDSEFEPNNGCPGPSGFELGENWFLIILDSQWWINESFRDSVNIDVEGCEFKTRTEVMNRTAELAEEHGDKNILLAFHHALFSNGNHGGFYPIRDHLFPFTNLVDNLYIPLPLVGSIYPIYRKLGRSGQDINHQRYQEFKRELRERMEDLEHVFFASGHEHSLGFYEREKEDENKEGKDFFILSGAGSKNSYARTGYGAEFVYSHKGFAKLISYEDGSIDVQFWVPDKDAPKGKMVYYDELITPEADQTAAEKIAMRRKDYEGTEDTVRTIQAGAGYAAGPFHRWVWGDHYRDAWTAEVQVPVFDFDTKKGGLKVLDVTGGEQTITIIVQDSSKNKYVMRSVQKNPVKSLPDVLQETLAADVAKDQTSASHPYGVLIVPTLSEAAGVYGTKPEIGYISKKSGVKMDVGEKEGAVVTFEEFVSTDWFNNNYNKKAVDMISSDELWERKRRGGNVKVDEKQLVRSRIFDMFLGDWDRHEGQWFWAETRTDSVSVYEPIPIDRDNAFFKSDGAIPWLGRRKWALRKFQLFDDDIRDMAGMNFNARFFDRWFINELSREDWMAIANEMQQALTDSVIERAIDQWPEPIQKISGETFTRKLKQRRDKITEFAERYYNILAEEPNVYGSDQPDLFEVKRMPGGKTSVAVFEMGSGRNDGKGTLRYERTFKTDETGEIRLFGFGEDDRFTLTGNTDKAVTIRLLGGEGQDIIDDQSQVDGRSKNTLVYDTDYGRTIISDNGEIASKISDDPRINRFDNRAFKYNVTAPLVTAGYKTDEGIFLGGGALITTQGFRKEPFAAQHRITAKRSLMSSSFSANYHGEFTNEIGPLNLTLDAEVLAPKFVTNYFGLGNETKRLREDYNFYDYEIDNVDLAAGVSENLDDLVFLNAGFGYEYFMPRETKNNFLDSPASDVEADEFDRHHFATLNGGVEVNTLDDPLLTHYGADFHASAELNIGLNDNSQTFVRLKSDITGYYTFESITTTVASRLGVATNIGGYDFFQANTLGGQRVFTKPGNLRGFARNRFSGRTSLYHNTELRTKLGDFSSYLFPAKFGVNAFFDEGRVFTDGEISSLWHVGYGGGVWISPLDYFVVDANYAISKEDEFISVTLGFTF